MSQYAINLISKFYYDILTSLLWIASTWMCGVRYTKHTYSALKGPIPSVYLHVEKGRHQEIKIF